VLETNLTNVVRKPHVRAKISNRSGRVAGLDGRRRDARRVRDLVVGFIQALGGPAAVDAATMMKVKRAAELTTAVEMLRARLLRGEPVDQLALSRLQGCSDRAVRALNIKPAESKPVGPFEHLGSLAIP
jgi:hypothetical protein